jgi:hypothetical protein
VRTPSTSDYYHERRRKRSMVNIAVALLIVGIPVAGYKGCARVLESTEEHVTITVTDKQRVGFGSGESRNEKYLIYTETETFENTDTMIYGKHNSADFYGRLKVGHTYRVMVTGWRNPLWSSYRNIVRIHDENQGQTQ